MIGIFKMDLYRLFKTKSMYIIWGVLAFLIILINYVSTGVDGSAHMDSILQNMSQSITLGSIFISVFAVIFSTADVNSGYIKNFGGQLPERSILILSKSFSLLIYTILTILLLYIIHAVDYWFMSRTILSGSSIYNNGTVPFAINNNDVKSFFIEIVLNFALALLCMSIAIIIRKTSIAMVIAVAIGSGVLSSSIIYLLVNSIASGLGFDKFHANDYGLLGNMLHSSPEFMSTNVISRNLIVAVIFIVISTVVSCLIFKKRDIV